MRPLLATSLCLALALTLPGCTMLGGEAIAEPADSEIGKRGFDVRSSDFDHHLENMVRDTWKDDFTWPNGKGLATIEVFFQITEGTERVSVTDATGKTIWEKTYTTGSGYEVIPLGTHAKGEWHVIMDRTSVSGEMRVHLFQRDGS